MAPKYDPNLEVYLKEYQANPRSRVFAPLAEAYRKSGLVDEAIDICKEGLEYHPNFISGMVALARCYFDKGQYTASIKELEKVVSEAPDNFLAQKLLAESYSLMGDSQNALKAYKMLLFLNPKDEEAKRIIADMESSHQSKPSSETIAGILGDNLAKKEEEVILPPTPFVQERPPMFELKKEIVSDLMNESELGFEERPAYQAFNIIGEEDQEKILTEIGTTTMGELLEKQGHKQKALEVYKNIYNKTLDEKVKEKIEALEISLGIKGYAEPGQRPQEELPKEMFFHSDEPDSGKDSEPNIIVYNPEPIESPVVEEELNITNSPEPEEVHNDGQWMSPIQGAPQDQRLKMLQDLLAGFQQYRKSS